jgi:hypothetical protein
LMKTLKRRYKRKAKAKAKSRTPKVDRVVTKIFKYVATTPNTPTASQDCLLANAKNTFVSDSMCWRVSNIPGVTDFRGVYTMFRFDKITVRFLPMTVDYLVDDQDQGTSSSNISKAIPRFYFSRVYGSETASEFSWVNENSAILTARKQCRMTKPCSLSWVPNTLTPSQISRAPNSAQTWPSGTAWVIKKKQWHSLADTNTLFYGAKYAISSTFQDDGEFLYKCIVTCKISFKGRNDSNYGVQTGGGTILIPIQAQT